MPKTKPKPEAKHYHGHRDRLKQRFQKGGLEAVARYELLEMALFLAIPRGDVKPLAKELLNRFGSLSGIFNASPEVLQEIKGVGPGVIHVLKVIRGLAIAETREEMSGKNVLSSWRQVVDYCFLTMVNDQKEQVRLFFLDKKNKLILDELHQVGTIDETPLYPREVIHRALNLGASGLILVHNHPSGDPVPSTEDVRITLKIQEIGKGLGVSVLDHWIIGRGEYVSMKNLGILL